MVRVPGWAETVDGETKQFRDFFLRRFEVTNREFQIFVDDGGYRLDGIFGSTRSSCR